MKLFYNVFYSFFVVLEIILFVYLVLSIIPINNKFRKKANEIINPILAPFRYLLKYSVFNTNTVDLSPIICFVVITYLQRFFYTLM